MSSFESITESARRWSESFRPDELTARPTRGLVVLCCMDARIDLFRLLGLAAGDAHILRNAGGRVTDDMIRSIIVSSHALGTREILVIHHTECGLAGVTNADLRTMVRDATGADPSDIAFHPFDDVEESVREDVARVRACPYLSDDMIVWGAVYDVNTGTLTLIDH